MSPRPRPSAVSYTHLDVYKRQNVSHDLRTPLTMIKSYAEMIRDLSGDIPEKRDAHLQVIIDETDRLNVLVNDMLNMSRRPVSYTHLDVYKRQGSHRRRSP